MHSHWCLTWRLRDEVVQVDETGVRPEERLGVLPRFIVEVLVASTGLSATPRQRCVERSHVPSGVAAQKVDPGARGRCLFGSRAQQVELFV